MSFRSSTHPSILICIYSLRYSLLTCIYEQGLVCAPWCSRGCAELLGACFLAGDCQGNRRRAAQYPHTAYKHRTVQHAYVYCEVLQVTSSSICVFVLTVLPFQRELIEEVDNFERAGLPVSRPNSMNNYGVILDEIGFTPMLADLREKCVLPFAKLLFARNGGTSLDSHHGFVVCRSPPDFIPF